VVSRTRRDKMYQDNENIRRAGNVMQHVARGRIAWQEMAEGITEEQRGDER
jgi:hypothetical protein